MLKLKEVEGATGTVYYVVGMLNGIRVNRSTGFGPREKRKANAELKRIEDETLSQSKPAIRGSYKIKDGLQGYLSRPEGVGKTTESYVRRFVKKFGDFELETVMPIDIIKFCSSARKSKSTIRREINSMQGYLNFLRDGLMLSPIKVRKPAEPAPKKTRFSVEERDHMLSVCEAEEPWFVPHLTFLFYTGARRSELCKLRWADIVLDELTGEPAFILMQSKKGKSGRVVVRRVPIHPVLLPAIKALRMLRRPQPQHRVFLSCTGQPINTPSGINKAFDRVAEVAGLSHLTPHDARRTFASQLLSAGVSDVLITDMLGHVDKKMLPIYAVADDSVRMNAIRNISAPMGG